jgi:hypothetical protein
MPPKRRAKNKGKVSAKQAEKIALKTAYSLIPKKLTYTEGTDFGPGQVNNASPWVIIQPAFIDQGFSNYSRLGDQVYIEKCSGFFNVSFNVSTTNRVEIRELVGFYKGSTDAQDKNIANFGASDLATLLPNKMTSWDRDNFYIKHDKSYDLMPQQVYNSGPPDGNNAPTGIWRSKRIPLSHHLYRKFRYTNNAQGGTGNSTEGSYAASNHPVGWKPFIALQIRCPDQDFTNSNGINPGPYVDYKFRTQFKDMQ